MRIRTACGWAGAGLVLAGAGGCLDRTMVITSEPTGATVTVNDVEVGRTPVEASFTYYGEYDVRVEKEGFEPLRTRATARAPLSEVPPFDLAASAVPARIENKVRWHFVLEPAMESRMDARALEAGMKERAAALRDRVEPAKP